MSRVINLEAITLQCQTHVLRASGDQGSDLREQFGFGAAFREAASKGRSPVQPDVSVQTTLLQLKPMSGSTTRVATYAFIAAIRKKRRDRGCQDPPPLPCSCQAVRGTTTYPNPFEDGPEGCPSVEALIKI